MVRLGLQTRLKAQPLTLRRVYGYGRRVFRPDTIWQDPEFKRYYDWLLETQWWSRKQLLELQLERLHGLLDYAYTNIPFYRDLFDDHGLTPRDIATLDDLKKIPIIKKEDIRRNGRKFLPDNGKAEKLHAKTTGGTTGTPLVLYYDDTVHAHEEAFRMRQWHWAGYRPGDRLLVMRDDFLGRDGPDGIIKWDYETTQNALVLSTFHLNEQSLPGFVALAGQFRPQYIEAFPSALGLMANYMRRHDISGIHPNAIFCESENLLGWQRELIELQFGCRIFAGYGDSERAVDAVECEHHRGYHLSMEYGILEIVDDAGRPVTEEGQLGRAIGTGLDTYSMPMIRYDTEDIVQFTQRECTCGRNMPLISGIEGRAQEFIVTADEELISLASINVRTPSYNNVEQFQFLQENKGELTLRIVPSPTYSAEDTRQILEELRAQFHNKVRIEPDFVDSIPRTARGKYRFLDQRLGVGTGRNLHRQQSAR